MESIKISFPRAGLFYLVCKILLVSQIYCGLQPYYLHFPPPLPVPYDNRIETELPYLLWPHPSVTNNEAATRRSSLPGGGVPVILHAWAKPENYNGTKLENGTVLYFVTGPWGGIRSFPHASPKPPREKSAPSNDFLPDPIYATVTPKGSRDETEIPQNQAGIDWQNPSSDIIPPSVSTREEGQTPNDGTMWGDGQNGGFDWSTIPVYDTATETPLSPNSVTLRSNENSTESDLNDVEFTTTQPDILVDEPTTVDSVAASTNNRFPVSESVKKFRRIVAQIRAITKKELAVGAKKKS